MGFRGAPTGRRGHLGRPIHGHSLLVYASDEQLEDAGARGQVRTRDWMWQLLLRGPERTVRVGSAGVRLLT
jgi:hypothetical protein